ncbi:MAG: OsmC family protein [Trichlorobacter sp.]|jgi:ribosomal protein S12 methylthiotransferase accessory factor|nr:OsmC family protein [Trichlorobacter sp.]
MKATITFEGGKKLAATFEDGTRLLTDQPLAYGGEGKEPSPYACFLGSIATCAGVFVLDFCTARKIPTDAISLEQTAEFEEDDQGKQRLAKVITNIILPADFPEKYRAAVVRAANLCPVKKAIMNAPEFVLDYKVV